MGQCLLHLRDESWWPWTSLLIPRSSFISVSSNACSVLYNMAVSNRSLLHTGSPWFNTLPGSQGCELQWWVRIKHKPYLKAFFPGRRAEGFFNCKHCQTERMSLHSTREYRNKGNSEAAWNSSVQVLLYFGFMYFCLTANSSHSMRSQSPAGQSAAHSTLRNNSYPKGITELARERGYCPHLAHGELQQRLH